MKKVLAFDLDGTLAPSKSPMHEIIAEQLNKLLENYHLCIISGGKFEQFQMQVLDNLKAPPASLERLHIMPTCGTRYYKFNIVTKKWEKIYAEDFSATEKKKIISTVAQSVKHLGYDKEKTWGEQIEDRGSQITFSALGQQAPVDAKEAWDPDNSKKLRIRDLMEPLLPEFEVRAGGTTSIDITKKGIDKAYGMEKLMDLLGLSKEQILFFGDKLEEGGNDYPVKAMGIDCVEVSHWQETSKILQSIIYLHQ